MSRERRSALFLLRYRKRVQRIFLCERHPYGPRCYLFGQRIHEFALGLFLIAISTGLWVVGHPLPWHLTTVFALFGGYALFKDRHDLIPSRRNTNRWGFGSHRPHAFALRRNRLAWTGPMLAALATVTGLVNLISTLTPNVHWRGRLLLSIEPLSYLHLFHALAFPASLALLASSPALWRRRRRAWQLALSILCLLTIFNLLKGLDIEEAGLSAAAALLLWRARPAFVVKPRPLRIVGRSLRALMLTVAVALTATVVIAIVAPGRADIDQILLETGRLLLWQHGTLPLPRHLRWLPLAISLSGVGTASIALWQLLRPGPAPRRLPNAQERESALALVRAHGHDTLAFFKLREDLHYLFSADGQAFAGYRIEAGALLISGDPVGHPGSFPDLLEQLFAFADQHELRVGVIGAGKPLLDFYRRYGLHSFYIGDEAVVDTNSFSLEGRAIRKVRQSVSRLRAAGYEAELIGDEALTAELVSELEQVSERWRGGEAEKGFSMAIDQLSGSHHCDSLILCTRDEEGRIRGFLHFVPTYGRKAMSLSHMRRDLDTPNGLTEFMVVSAIEQLREKGIDELSLNFAAFGQWLREPATSWQRAGGHLVRFADRWLQTESLYRFNAKFFPHWQPRYALYVRVSDLPRLALATMRAEGQI